MKQLVFGITGTTGSGKTTISKIFEQLGVKVIDADKVYHSLIEPGMPCVEEIAEHFGTGVLKEDGSLDRKALAGIVFCDKEKLRILNKITHKYIRAEISAIIAKNPLCAIDAAVLIGSEVAQLCQYIVTVTADSNIRKRRIMERDLLSEEEAEQRIASQKSDSFYIENSDFVIYNNDNCNPTEDVKRILSAMRGE